MRFNSWWFSNCHNERVPDRDKDRAARERLFRSRNLFCSLFCLEPFRWRDVSAKSREKKDRRRPWLPLKGAGRFAGNETVAKKEYRELRRGTDTVYSEKYRKFSNYNFWFRLRGIPNLLLEIFHFKLFCFKSSIQNWKSSFCRLIFLNENAK